MKNYLCFIPIILFFSCSRNKADFEKNIIEKKWINCPYEKINKEVKFIHYLKFHEDYTVESFSIESDSRHVLLDIDQGVQEWSYSEKDNNLIFYGYKFKILSFNSEAILMQEQDDESKIILYNITDKSFDPEGGLKINNLVVLQK